MFDQMTAAVPLVKAGKLKLLAVTTAKRIALAPQTADHERGGRAGLRDVVVAGGLCAQGHAGADRRTSCTTRSSQILQDARGQGQAERQLGMEIVGSTPDELAALMQKEIPRWGELIKKSGASAD